MNDDAADLLAIPIRSQRIAYEGPPSPAICAGCGYSLSEVGRCPKCRGTAREVAAEPKKRKAKP